MAEPLWQLLEAWYFTLRRGHVVAYAPQIFCLHCSEASYCLKGNHLLALLYRTQNGNRTIGSHTVAQILNDNAVIIVMLSRSHSDRGFLKGTHLSYVNANTETRNNKCMN